MRPTLRPNLYGLFFLFIAIATANGQSRTADFRENKVQAGAHEAKVTVSGNAQLRPVVQKIAEGLKAPIAEWHIVIVGESDWRNLDCRGTASACSIIASRVTYLHADWIKTHQAVALRHELAHELGHLITGSDSEAKAEAIARNLIASGTSR